MQARNSKGQFTKGGTGYWYGKKRSKKDRLKIGEKTKIAMNAPEVKKKLSLAWLGKKGKENNSWKGDAVGYSGIHWWLRETFGNANHCDNAKCLSKSKRFEWAKLKGKGYQRKRNNFFQLCKSCHATYDMPLSYKRQIEIVYHQI